MKHFLTKILILISVIFIYSCKENIHLNKFEMNIYCAAVDTLDGLEFAYRVNIDNGLDREINFYTGLDESENSTNDGFYLKFNKLGKSYQMTSLIKKGVIIIPSQAKNKKFIIDVCFREYCKNISDFPMLFDTYYKSKSKVENIRKLMKDISIEYRVNKSWNNKNYQSAFKNDSIIYFNRLDTIDTNFYTEITGETFNQMLKKGEKKKKSLNLSEY